jgi:hypothetical protein
MFNRSVTLRGLVLLAGACVFSGAVLADGPEVVGFAGGATYGAGGGTHPVFGGGGSFGFGDSFRVLGEVGYGPLLSMSSSQSGVDVSVAEHLLGVGGGVEYSFMDAKSKVRPYVVGAVGLEHFTISGSGTNGTTSVSLGTSSNSVYFGGGGGLRYFIGKSWGIKPEIRYQHSADTGNSIVYSVGFFFRFGD